MCFCVFFFQLWHYIFTFVHFQGTLLNSKSLISSTTVKALKEASSRGVKIVVATGKVRNFILIHCQHTALEICFDIILDKHIYCNCLGLSVVLSGFSLTFRF